MGRERQHALVGAASVGALSGPGSGKQNALLPHTRSSEEVAYLTAGEVFEDMGFPRDILGRGGEQVREEAVER